MNNELNLEKKIQEKGLIAPRLTPRLTPALIDETIEKESYHRLTDVSTVCVLTLRNGFTVTGESACASPENYNEELCNKIAKENARDKVWLLEGYLLKQKLHEESLWSQTENIINNYADYQKNK